MADLSHRNEGLYYLSCTLYNTAVPVVTGVGYFAYEKTASRAKERPKES